MKLKESIFVELYDQMIEKFSVAYEQKYHASPTIIQTFEADGHDVDEWTLSKHMLKQDKVNNYIEKYKLRIKNEGKAFKFNPRYYYDKRNRLRNKSHDRNEERLEKIKFPYGKIMLLYLGFDQLEDYIKQQDEKAIKYIGYYYSYLKHEVCTFELNINYNRKPVISSVPHSEFTVEQIGYHDHKPPEPLYTGYGYLLAGKLQLMLWAKEGGDRLRILLDSGDDPENQDAMRGIILAVSSFPGKPLTTTETVIVKEGVLQTNDELRIKRYLFLHRYNFRTDSKPLNLHSMAAKRFPSDFLRNLVGAWRVFRFYGDRFISSILYVGEDYNITCFNNYYDLDNLNEQVCLPSISTEAQLQNRNTVILESYPKEGARIISSLMLNIPDANDRVTGGVISIVGGNNGYPSSSAVALGRDDQLYEKLNNSSDKLKEAKMELDEHGDLEKKLNTPNAHPIYRKIAKRLKKIEDATLFRLPEEIRQLLE